MRKFVMAVVLSAACAEEPPTDLEVGQGLEVDMDGAVLNVAVECDKGDEVVVDLFPDGEDEVAFRGKRVCEWTSTSVRVEIDIPGTYMVMRPYGDDLTYKHLCMLTVTEEAVEEQLQVPSCFE